MNNHTEALDRISAAIRILEQHEEYAAYGIAADLEAAKLLHQASNLLGLPLEPGQTNLRTPGSGLAYGLATRRRLPIPWSVWSRSRKG